ncbi:hypothetical protein [Burkholderia sp. LMG 32019]|uniref:hypothetical protein n=1 Tax=Burkholderia sp. LMG 32019 TaxID=3158173 RepID=UPI003C2F8DA8
MIPIERSDSFANFAFFSFDLEGVGVIRVVRGAWLVPGGASAQVRKNIRLAAPHIPRASQRRPRRL